MQFSLQLNIEPFTEVIKYTDTILLTGSCFTEHISERLAQHKFNVVSNPHGILFNPLSVADSLDRYVSGKEYVEEDLFYLNELWNSWEHHTRFSDIDTHTALANINHSLQQAHTTIKDANWIIITVGSSFHYCLKENEHPVANNHRAPAQWFEKRLLDTNIIEERLQRSIQNIQSVNPYAKFIFTISPVRHIRDGVIANSRSKARLIEAIHSLCEKNANSFYFPAYELLIDILRDYRFYDIDFVHPNYMATQFVWEKFVKTCMNEETQTIMKKVAEIVMAKKHKPRFPETEAHQKFMKESLMKVEGLIREYSFLDLKEERAWFDR